MKKNIVFFLLGAFIFTNLTALASSKVNLIEILYNVNDIVINGNSKIPEDRPFTYKDTTYVPLRYIAEELDCDVKWDGTHNIINIDSKKVNTSDMDVEASTYIVGSTKLSFSAPHYSIEEKFTMAYEQLNSSTELTGNYIMVPIEREFTTFKGTLKSSFQDGRALSGDMVLNIYLDNTLLYTKELNANTILEDTHIELDITKGAKIQFEIVTLEDNPIKKGIEIGMYDCTFIK